MRTIYHLESTGPDRGPRRASATVPLLAVLLLLAGGCSDGGPTDAAMSSSEIVSPAMEGTNHLRLKGAGVDVTDVARGPMATFEPQRGRSRTIVVELRGTATGEFRDIDGVQMICYDVGLFDVTTGRRLGDGMDCWDLNTIAGGDPTFEGFAISNTTFFHLRGGSLMSRNRTTIQPVIDGSPGMTHLTGDLATENNILDGTRRFAGAEGTSVLRGAVDMSQFFSDAIISFNCLYVLSLN
jgi:hypothetical protein